MIKVQSDLTLQPNTLTYYKFSLLSELMFHVFNELAAIAFEISAHC